jgi:predicted alpha-1,2-mannosidase
MTNRQRLFYSLLTGVVFFIASCNQKQGFEKSTFFPVDPFIGSGGHGHVFVGANVPFGAIQLGPSNIYKGWDWCSGYHYSDSILIGFAHTHLSGTGIGDLGDILIMPVTGKVNIERGNQDDISNGYAAKYCHCDEEAQPGYYSLNIRKYGVKAELTATERVGMHRYTFPKADDAYILIDLKEGNADRATETYLKQIDEYTIEGYRFSRGWARNRQIWFTLASNRKIANMNVYDDTILQKGNELKSPAVKGVISFEGTPEEVILKVGISPVSCKNALGNIEAEMPGWNFDKVASSAENKWKKELSKIAVETSDPEIRKIFYTSLYHTFFAPVLFNDAKGDYRGTDKKIYSEPGFQNYSIFSLWDTYRTQNPLLTLTQPERVNDFIHSMLNIYKQQGKLPVWHLLGNETNTMPGYSAVPVVVDAWNKGFNGFDENLAFEAVTSSATLPAQKGVPYVIDRGYIPCDSVREATSIAMEYAVDDACIALMAKKMGKQDAYNTFSERAGYYKTYFDEDIHFIRPKMADGSWRIPYSPFTSVHMVGDFTEGNGWQYSFFAPHDPEGLIDLFGGDEAFIAKLDSFFVVEGDMGDQASADITGLIGMYAHGNEPSHHIAYLYAFAGQQWKTAEKVRYILDEFYTTGVDGLIGNEDCGQMSAWYVMSSLGFYPVHPANGVYVFGSPLMNKATIHLPEGKTFTIESVNNSDKNMYIQSAELNGEKYQKSFITHSDIVKGGSLIFHMGSEPNVEFGNNPANRPHSE